MSGRSLAKGQEPAGGAELLLAKARDVSECFCPIKREIALPQDRREYQPAFGAPVMENHALSNIDDNVMLNARDTEITAWC